MPQQTSILTTSILLCAFATLQGVAAAQNVQAELRLGNTVATVDGFDGPEAVRYDPEQDIYFVSNFSGDVSGDANAFVSKVSANGRILEREFMSGSSLAPFHGGRGMFIEERKLWVADADGIHAFDRLTGAHLDFVDFSSFEPGFLNDIVIVNNGNLFVTDTGTSRLFRVADGVVSVATETPFPANGITINPANGRLVLAPWADSKEFVEWDAESNEFTSLGHAPEGGRYDGIEFVYGSLLSASQEDSSLHLMANGEDEMAMQLPGRPADIGVDTKRMRVAVPYVGLNQVDIIAIIAN